METPLFDDRQKLKIDGFMQTNITEEQKKILDNLKTKYRSDDFIVNPKEMDLLIRIFDTEENTVQASNLYVDKYNENTAKSLKIFSRYCLSKLIIKNALTLTSDSLSTIDAYSGLQEISLKQLPATIQKEQLEKLNVLQELTTLRFIDCERLEKIPEKLCSIRHMEITNLKNLISFDLRSNSLQTIEIKNCIKLPKINLENIINIRELTLSNLPMIDHDLKLNAILLVEKIIIEHCEKIKNIENNVPDNPNNNLVELSITKLKNLKGLGEFKGIISLEKFEINNCNELEALFGLKNSAATLEQLMLVNMIKLKDFTEINSLKKIKQLTLNNCSKLTSLKDLNKKFPELKKLSIAKLSKLTLNNLKDEFGNLTHLEIEGIPVSNFNFLKSCKILQDLTLVLEQKFEGEFPTLDTLQNISLQGLAINNLKTVILSLREDIAEVTIEKNISGITINKFHEFITENHELLQKISSFKKIEINNNFLQQSIDIHNFYQKIIDDRIAAIAQQLTQASSSVFAEDSVSKNNSSAPTSPWRVVLDLIAQIQL